MRLLRIVSSLVVVLAALWALSDLLFSLEYSWILFLYRVLAPVTLVATLGLLGIRLFTARLRSEKLSPRALMVWGSIVVIGISPAIRSLAFIPLYTVSPPNDAPTVSVLTMNALGFRDLSAAIITEIEHRNPDLVAIQEVNPILAKALEARFNSTYACRVLKPAEGSWGMGTLARNPCTERPLNPTGSWVGPPIIIETTTPTGSPITLANFHAIHPHAGLFDAYPEIQNRTDLNLWRRLSQPIHDRQQAIEFLMNAVGDPTQRYVLLTGDLNASMRNGVYATLRNAEYHDAWLDRNSVVRGGTWPAPEFLGNMGLGWLVRIDFIFRSPSLLTSHIELLPEGLQSDHRGMFARFAVS